jgi:ribosomal protein L27
MMKMNLQLFAHKKGVGSTKNGREIRCEKSRRTVCKSRKHSLQTARN